jgi:hypothetical protein
MFKTLDLPIRIIIFLLVPQETIRLIYPFGRTAQHDVFVIKYTY